MRRAELSPGGRGNRVRPLSASIVAGLRTGPKARELEFEPGATTRTGGHADVTSKRVRDRADNRQPQAGAAGRASACGVDPVEPLKDPLALPRRDTWPIVEH